MTRAQDELRKQIDKIDDTEILNKIKTYVSIVLANQEEDILKKLKK